MTASNSNNLWTKSVPPARLWRGLSAHDTVDSLPEIARVVQREAH